MTQDAHHEAEGQDFCGTHLCPGARTPVRKCGLVRGIRLHGAAGACRTRPNNGMSGQPPANRRKTALATAFERSRRQKPRDGQGGFSAGARLRNRPDKLLMSKVRT